MRSFHTRAIFAGAVLVALVAGSAPVHGEAAAKKFALKYNETSLGKLPKGYRNDSLIFSRDGMHAAWLVKGPSGWTAVLDGVAQKEYEWILANTLAISPDGQRIAYAVQAGDKMVMVAGGVESKPFREVDKVVFSRDGKRAAYLAWRTAKSMLVVLDGLEGQEYESISPRSLVFSPDGSRFAFVADRAGKRMWVVEGKEGQPYDGVAPITFSADGKRMAYMAERGGRQLMVVDGKEGKEYDHAGAGSFSADGKRFAFAAERDKRLCTVLDGKEGKEYDWSGPPIFSPDGQHIACAVMRNKVWMVTLDGEEGQGYDAVGEIRFSGDSKHLAYKVADGRRQKLVVDGRETKLYELVGTWAISQDGAHVAFAARTVTAEKVGDCLVIDGSETRGPGFLTMSPDGRYVAHSFDTPTGSKVMVNEVEGKEFPGFPFGNRWVFQTPTKFVLMTVRDFEVFRVEVEIVEP